MTAIHVTDASFERDVIDRSFEAPVIVDFWAEWCAPCRALGPILERLADEAEGAWTLAKLDVDSNPMAASAFQIQGIPAVKALKDGKLVAEFTGALPEPQVRTWLARLGPSPADVAAARGREAEDRGDLDAAEDLYRTAFDAEPGHAGANSGLARIGLLRRTEAHRSDDLRRRLAADPLDVEAAQGLADALALDGDFEAATALLLDVVRAASGEIRERAREHLVKLLSLLPADDPRAVSARKALSRALF